MYTCTQAVVTKLGNTPSMSYLWTDNWIGHTVKMFMKTYVHVDEDRNAEMSDFLMGNTSLKVILLQVIIDLVQKNQLM